MVKKLSSFSAFSDFCAMKPMTKFLFCRACLTQASVYCGVKRLSLEDISASKSSER